MTSKHGGPAFPRAATLYPSNAVHSREQEGMTLRDYFAIHAMQALMPIWDRDKDFDLCQRAYRIAEHMLEARSK